MASLMDLAASAAAVVEPSSAPATPLAGSAASSVGDGVSPPARKRARAPRIDIDAAIFKHMEEIKRASKLVNDARRAARNERRRKSRLMKKAATLTPDDLERVAVLKRCGLFLPAGEDSIWRHEDCLKLGTAFPMSFGSAGGKPSSGTRAAY